ncbi:NADH:ubiquinone oxidoreductase subunit NDUFA12 [Sneathiella sp.]|uniref:NADH:ubiquinone oxidoreductase subunit NDUFA12 n=1 Tax=Sneathiella sp. TaxID=1964365 RepID=UPI002FDF2DC8
MATIGTRLFTWLRGELVGEDQFGNRYYREKGKPTGPVGRERRWVIYKGKPEASKVPPAWHIWLHYTTDLLPGEQEMPQAPWIEEHVPNLTGTDLAYRPEGSILKTGKRQRGTGDYEPWRP